MARQEKGALPGSTTMLVLALLRSEEMYGYQIIEELEKRSEEVFKLKEGTLYPILHTLEKERLVTARETESPSGRQRRYYRITAAGKAQLAEEKKQWEVFSTSVERVIGARGFA